MSLILGYFLQCIFIILPLFLAGIFFIFLLKKGFFVYLAKPIDLGLTIGKKRLFGNNKTFRGIIIIPIATFVFWMLIAIILKIMRINPDLFVFDYNFSGYIKILIFALAYPIGELPNSFIKRRLGIEPGCLAIKQNVRFFFNFYDLVDSLILCFFVLLFVYKINIAYALGAFFIGTLIHCFTDVLMRKIKLKEKA
ncbi:MAG: CDP-archaeol synthase [bacterium]|nr:CDP-archaeol synthase [bacterium]